MYGVMLIAVLVITGGAIAFIGDRLGTKIGKKKISIFGLRPRDTSTIITIVTGICITTLTFAVMAATSENVRTALFGMEKLNRRMAETQEKLNTASGELELLQKKQEQLKKYAGELAEGNKALEKEKEELTRQNGDLSQKNAGLMDLNGKLLGDNRSLQRHNDDLRTGLQIIREGEISFRAGEVIASGVISGSVSKQEVTNLLGMLVKMANRNSALRLGVREGEADIEVYQPEYDAAIEAITRNKQDVVVRIVAAGNLIRGESVKTYLELFRNHVVYRRNEYVISQGYEISSISKEEAEELVMSFLQIVNHEATSKGILPDPVRGSVGVVEGAQFYDLVSSLTGKSGKIVINAFAVSDTDVLGPLRVVFKLEFPDGQ